MYYRASSFQRFCAYTIDMLLLSTLCTHIVSGIFILVNYNSDIITECLQNLTYEIQNDGDIDTIYQLLIEIIRRYAFEFAVMIPTYLVLDILYLVILPHFWKKQTLGRLVAGCKVVAKNGDLRFSRLLLRELVGTFLFYQVFGYLGIFISAILVFAFDRSIVDIISKTSMVNARIAVVNPNNSSQYNNYNNNSNDDFNNNINKNYDPNDVIDAKVEDKTDSLNDDDEYKVI